MKNILIKLKALLKLFGLFWRTHNKSTYEQVVKNQTGHFEVVEVTYDVTKVNYSELVKVHLNNIDPFDNGGQFCDRGKVTKQLFSLKIIKRERP